MKKKLKKWVIPLSSNNWGEDRDYSSSLIFPQKESFVLIDTVVPFATRDPAVILSDRKFYYNMCPFVKQSIASLGTYSGCMSVRVCHMLRSFVPREVIVQQKTFRTAFGLNNAAIEFALFDALVTNQNDNEIFQEIHSLMSETAPGKDRPKCVLSFISKAPDSGVPQMVYLRKRKTREKGAQAHNTFFVSSLYAAQEKNAYVIECRIL